MLPAFALYLYLIRFETSGGSHGRPANTAVSSGGASRASRHQPCRGAEVSPPTSTSATTIARPRRTPKITPSNPKAKPPNFTQARMTEALGVNANLRGCNFTEADLTNADLTEANLEGGVLVRARLVRTAFRRANLKLARLTGATAIGADFSGTNMVRTEAQEADFSESDFRFCQLVGAKLVGASFQNANLSHSDFSEAELGGSSFVGAQGEAVKFTGQYHLRLVLAAGAFMNAKKKVSKMVEGQREVERQSRIATIEKRLAERDRSVAAREASGEKDAERDREKRGRGEDPSIVQFWRSPGIALAGGRIADREFQMWIDWLVKDGALKPGQLTLRELFTNEFSAFPASEQAQK